MNRFFRSGLLPLILIVLVVYLASTQLMSGNKNEKKVTLSQYQNYVLGGPGRQTPSSTRTSSRSASS